MAVNVDIRNKLPTGSVVFDNHAYDNSIIGITLDGKVIYGYERMIKELMNDEHWNETDAIEWVEYNTIRSLPYFGDKAPIIVYLETLDIKY